MNLVILGGVFLLVGLGCARGLIGLARQERQLADGVTVPGEVVDFETKVVTRSSNMGGRRQVTQYFPVIRFRTAAGQEQQATSPYAWNGQVGQSIKVVYARSDPALVRVKGNQVAKVGMPIIGGVGGLFLILGVVFLAIGLRDVL